MDSTVQGTADGSSRSRSSYVLNKCVIGYGIVNGVVNAVIFYLMHAGDPLATFDRASIALDMTLTGVLLSLILMACAVPLTRHDMKRQAFDSSEPLEGWRANLSKSPVAAALLVAAASTAVTVGVAMGASLLLPLPLGVIPMMVFKGVLCALAGGVSGCLSIYYAIARPADA